jgi:hypothetical protein
VFDGRTIRLAVPDGNGVTACGLSTGRDERGEQRYDEVRGTLAVASSGGLGIDATVRGSAFITRHQLSRVRELEIITAATSRNQKSHRLSRMSTYGHLC